MKSEEEDICPNFNLSLSLYSLRKYVLYFTPGNKYRGEQLTALSLNAALTRGPQADTDLS